jgi:hypothetical protein
MPRIVAFSLEDAEGRTLKATDDIEQRGVSQPTLVGPEDLRVFFQWWRWCEDAVPGPLHATATLADDGGVLKWDLPGSSTPSGTAITPPCKEDANLEVETWAAQ